MTNHETPSHIWLVTMETDAMQTKVLYAGFQNGRAEEAYKLAEACIDELSIVHKVRIPCDVLARGGFVLDEDRDYRDSKIVDYAKMTDKEPIHNLDWDYEKEEEMNPDFDNNEDEDDE